MATNNIDRQIFIGGCSRSGTTLLASMLGAHSHCICTPESHFKIDALRVPDWQGQSADLSVPFALIKRHWRFKIWELNMDAYDFPEKELNHSYACLLNWIVAGYGQSMGKPHARIWVDHTPENISYATTLLNLYPHAKMIHIVRDGRGVATSIMPLDWGPNTLIKAARWWLRMVSFGLAVETLIPKEQIIRVRYEDLVRQPEETLWMLCDYLDLEYQPEMANASGFKPPRYTNRQHRYIGKRPVSELATRWQKRLSDRQVEIFENLTRDFLVYLGYPLKYGLRAKPPTFFEIQWAKGKELYRGEIINKIKWLIRSYPLWLSRDFYAQARLTDTKN